MDLSCTFGVVNRLLLRNALNINIDQLHLDIHFKQVNIFCDNEYVVHVMEGRTSMNTVIELILYFIVHTRVILFIQEICFSY